VIVGHKKRLEVGEGEKGAGGAKVI